KQIEIDARPSDAIAIGLRFDASIYTYETILAEAGIVLTDENEDDIAEIKSELKSSTSSKKSSDKSDDLKNQSVDKLNELLNKAIEKEDYERAAKIRDELSRRN
ncbi:MAG: bifunctional nuclease domain-containing protein, partial [Bacteroidota bacterium]